MKFKNNVSVKNELHLVLFCIKKRRCAYFENIFRDVLGNEFTDDRNHIICTAYFIIILCGFLLNPNVEIPVFTTKLVDSPNRKQEDAETVK